jgi:hypothetical protein
VSNNCYEIQGCCYPKRNSDFLALISVLSPHIQQNLATFAKLQGNLNNTVKPSIAQTFLSIKVYNALAVPILLNGSEIWTIRKNDKKRLTSVEIKFFRRAAGYTLLDRKRNEEILEQLKVEPVDEKLRRYKSNWLRNVTRVNNRMPKIMLDYNPHGRRLIGRPLKTLVDEAEIGLSRPNL